MKHLLLIILLITSVKSNCQSNTMQDASLIVAEKSAEIEKQGYKIRSVIISPNQYIKNKIQREDLNSISSSDTFFVLGIALTNERNNLFGGDNLIIHQTSENEETKKLQIEALNEISRYSFKITKNKKFINFWQLFFPVQRLREIINFKDLSVTIDLNPGTFISSATIESDSDRKERLDKQFAIIIYSRN